MSPSTNLTIGPSLGDFKTVVTGPGNLSVVKKLDWNGGTMKGNLRRQHRHGLFPRQTDGQERCQLRPRREPGQRPRRPVRPHDRHRGGGYRALGEFSATWNSWMMLLSIAGVINNHGTFRIENDQGHRQSHELLRHLQQLSAPW